MNRAFLAKDIDELERLVHEKAEIASYLAPDEVLNGRDTVIDALRDAMAKSVYHVVIDTARDLSDTVAVGRGSVRYAQHHNTIAITHAAWLWKWEDGLLLRSKHYSSEDSALSAYDAEGDTFDLD